MRPSILPARFLLLAWPAARSDPRLRDRGGPAVGGAGGLHLGDVRF
jgi:hypothetical protein